ncbi:uncharacterized protein si:ch211-207l14.1 [Triplophysa dalaica]|uniref:uncharacterized protein si:ch211-207l14.1 n=1 Tax=Triplophysa dalaica TaxID=1582913 RepID=UPI0024DFD209|nr:uncharacterized protein si:ch211-207l14.1 [Triplophysa dalaica]
MENEEEEDEILTIREPGYEGQENVEELEEEEPEEEEPDTERKNSLDVPVPSRSLGGRRASLPCPAQLNAMHLSRLHAIVMTPDPAHLCHQLESSEARPCSRSHSDNEEGAQVKSSTSDRRPPAIPTIPKVHEPMERKARFRSRNIMSLSDANSVCLICHDDLRRGGGAIRELHCSHSFHTECIEEWLWTKQTCPTCRKHVVMPEPLYWTSTRVIVP